MVWAGSEDKAGVAIDGRIGVSADALLVILHNYLHIQVMNATRTSFSEEVDMSTIYSLTTSNSAT